MQQPINKLLLLLFIISLQIVNAQELKEKSSKQLCNEEIKKEVIDRELVNKYCKVVAKEYENKKKYGNASWYYLLANENDYNIEVIKNYSFDNKSNIGHSYVIKGDTTQAKEFYKEFLINFSTPQINDLIKDDYKLLIKLYPEKKDFIIKGQNSWNKEYNSYFVFLFTSAIQDSSKKKYKNAIKTMNKIFKIYSNSILLSNKMADRFFLELAYFYSLDKQFEEAVKILNKILAIDDFPEKEAKKLITIYYNLALKSEEKINTYDDAIKYQLLVLKIKKKIYTDDDIKIAITYNDIGLNYQSLYKFNKALKYYKKALPIFEKVLGKKHIDTANCYNNIGTLYNDTSDYVKALEYYKKALAIKEKVFGKEHINTAEIYDNLGRLYFNIDDYSKALVYVKKSLEIKEKVSVKKNIDIANSYNNIGLLYQKMNDYPKALKYFKKALEIKEKLLGVEHTDTATTYNNIGGLYQNINDYPKALEYFKKALEINEKVLGKEHTSTAISYNNIGGLYQDMNDYQKTLKYFQKSLEVHEKVLGKEHTDTATSYNNIGLLYQNINDYPKALEYYKKSLEIREQVFGKEHTTTAGNYNNIGSLYQAMNDYPKALDYLKKSLEINEIVLGIEHPYTARNYNNIGRLYHDMNDYPKALKYLKKSLEIRGKVLGKDHKDTAKSYNSIGLLYQDMNDHPEAYKYAKKSFDIFLKNRDKNFTILDNKQKLEYVKANSGKLESLLLSATLYMNQLDKENKKDEAKKIKEETLNNWLNYKGAIFDSENNMVVLYEKVKDKKIKDNIEELNSFKQQLSKLYQTIPKPDESEKYKKRISSLEKDISDSEIYLSTKLGEFKEELGLRDINYKDISSKLQDEEIYIDFAKTQDNYFVFTLDNKNNISFEKIDSKITSNINKNVKLFRENIDTLLKSTDLTKEKLDTLNSDAKVVLSSLYEDIVNNLSKTVSSIKTKDTLIFSLDGVLNFLPFEALYDKTTNKYLIEKKNIKYVPSGKEFVRLLNKKTKQTKTSKDITMFTNPDYGLNLPAATIKSSSLDTPNTRASSFLHKSLFSMIFKPLPGTKEEAKLISTLYSNAKDYNQEDATSENLFTINSPKILHISTHGFFLNDENIENPMLKSGLAFTGANMARVKGDSQGVVTGLKLAGLNLTNTDLVVLSACETGLGDIKGAEGVTGLNKAFIKAGAKNIVMSLWSVADKETAQLMKDFYSNVKDTNNYQQSLKDSKMKMIKQNLHPFYWSAFIMNGI